MGLFEWMRGWKGNGRPAGLASLRPRSAGLAWLCALAVAFQCIVVSGHIHTRAELAAVAPAPTSVDVSAEAGSAKKHGAPVDSSACFICQQLSIAGSAVLPEAPAPVLILQEAMSGPNPADAAFTHAAHSHHWLSRGPPILI